MAAAIQADPKPTLIFIPDISGFTEFVHTTEISHSQHIIEELLESIIDGNNIGLEVSEIEGDAILFFRMGDAPSAKELLGQIQNMYSAFHSHLKRYESQRICQCGACGSAHNLQLKFVMHYGIISRNQVKSFSKLFGKDLIVAHRLLKNNIELDEYALFTRDLMDKTVDWDALDSLTWAPSTELEESYDFGNIKYSFIPLQPLYESIPEPVIEDFLVHEATTEIIKGETIINAPLQLVFDVISDLSFRHEWLVGIKDSTDLNSNITQIGSTHRCLINGTEKDPFTVSHSFNINNDVITWTESDAGNKSNAIMSLKRLDGNKTQFKRIIQLKPSLIIRIIIPFIKPGFRKRLAESHKTLNAYCEGLFRDGKNHRSQVLIEASTVEEASNSQTR
ncbi:MAG: hypothetical protein DRI69_05915 [Bacteroidetes bacterium]|nr:MAG: hypothetical protein DRI69_05915 [Bacteroidota bacterium]